MKPLTLAIRRRSGRIGAGALLAGTAALQLGAAPASAAEVGDTTLDLYGFAMLDTGYQAGQNDPDWFDVVRPTKLPSFEDEFGQDGEWFASVRQTRFGVQSNTETSLGKLHTIFEFEMFGTGDDEGQTTIRLRHAYGELGQFGAGQYWSPFMDIDVFPNSVEYWGPNGMAFFRNVQLRWMPIKGDSRLTFALERPGASADQGDFAARIELQDITTNFPLPDLSAEYRHATGFGYLEIAGIVRYMEWTDQLDDGDDLSGDAVGWGVNLSSNIKFGRSTLKLAAVYGEGVQNYMNDAPADVGPVITGDPTRSLEGEALPLLGLTAFWDVAWSEQLSSTFGYSRLDIDTTNGQAANAFEVGEYALANVMFYPVKNVMFGPELQWGKRHNARDGFTSDDFRVQFSFKYNFSHNFTFGAK
jgi:DcaP outer membrane protein